MDKIAKDRIQAASLQSATVASFLAPIMMTLKKVETSEESGSDEVMTMGLGGKTIYYNTDYVKGMSIQEVGGSLLHEVMHALAGHQYPKEGRNMELWNVACDFAVNGMLKEMLEFIAAKRSSSQIKLPVLPEGILYDPKFNGMTADEIYFFLLKNQPPQQQQQNGDGEGQGDGQQNNNGKDGDGKNRGSHKKWGENNDNDGEQRQQKQQMKNMAAQMYHSIKKQYGSVPGGIEAMFGEITKPKKNWRQELAEFIEPEPDDYGFAPPDRRFQDLEFSLPSLCDGDAGNVKDAMIFADASGSVSDEELTMFASELHGAMAQFNDKIKGRFGYFDTEVYSVKPFESVQEIISNRPKGRGGTNFHKPFQWIKDQRLDNVAFIIIMTDGECNFPPEAMADGIPVLWVYSRNFDQKAPWGRTIHLKD